MLTTIATLWTASGINKYLPYIFLVVGAIATIITVYLKGQTAGSSTVLNKQLNDSLKVRVQEAKDRAKIQSLNTDAARIRLRDRWSAN